MTRRLWPGLGAGLFWCWAVLAAAPPEAGHAPAVAEDVQDVAVLTDARPVLLRLHLLVDGKPFRAVHREALESYLSALFKHLDADGDGVLNEREASRMPAPFTPPSEPTAAAVNVAFNYRVVDADGDGKVTPAELAEYHRQFSGGPVQVQPVVRTAVPPAVNEALLARLDADKDGKLSRQELAAAETALSALDQDRDDLLTPQELLPSFYAANMSAPALPNVSMRNRRAARPSLFVLSTDDRAALVDALRARYGKGAAAAELERFADEPADADLERFADGPADAELVVRLGKRVPGQEPLEIYQPSDKHAAKDAASLPTGDGGLVLTFGRAHVEFRVNDGRPEQAAEAKRRFLELFRAADVGKRGFLTRNEAQQSGFFPGQFALLDQNGDGKLTEAELTSYLDEVQARQARLIAATPALLTADRAQGLFEWLDRDRDGRLSLREVREAPKLLARLGREAEGEISREDFPECYQLAMGLGQASLSRAGPEAFTPREAPMLTLDWSGSGPLWFRKMDRNRDGDVSAREFLGTAEDFRRLDADGDGLISPEEAERAEALFKKK